MFGFLASCNRDLAYRSLYARCCQHQHLHYGKLSLPTLSYEAVFLYAFGLDAGAAGDYQPPRRSCCRLLGRRNAGRAPDRHLGEFAAALGLFLTAVELEDDIRDSRSLPVRTWKSVHQRLLARPIAKASAYFKSLDLGLEQRIAGYITAQANLEAEGTTDLARYLQPTSEAFSYLFGLMSRLSALSSFADVLQEVGEHVGAAMVTMDCATDWQADRRHSLPNPVKGPEQAVHALQTSREHVAAARCACFAAFGGSSRTASILANVEQRIIRRLDAENAAYLDNGLAMEQQPGVVLNAVCCIPCGDGAIAADSKDCDSCCNTLCLGCCCLMCCGPACCKGGW